MSERPIQVGDLVAVVRACCDKYVDGAWIYRVGNIDYDKEKSHCERCGTSLPVGYYAGEDESEEGVPISWLKRIPPLSELEGERTEDEVTA